MKKLLLLITATLIIYGVLNLVQNPPFLSSGPQASNEEQGKDLENEQAIRLTLNNYIEGANKREMSRLRSAFVTDAAILFVRDGKLTRVELGKFLENVTSGNLVVERKVLMIDVFGDAAIAKIESPFPDGLAMDYVSLLKIDNEWKIVSKVFSFIKKE